MDTVMHFMITGAAQGIGAALTDACVAAGHQVSACDINLDGLVARYGENAAVQCIALDVRDHASWQAALDQAWQQPVKPSHLINVAGILRAGLTGELNQQDIDLQIGVNFTGIVHGTNGFAARLIETGANGHIINVGSTAGVFATPGNAVYAASKHAVRGFTIAAAGDLRPKGIDVSLVAPTAVKTPMLEQQRGDERAALTFEGARALTPNEVASAILNQVVMQKPLEYFLPKSDQWTGRLCTSFPEFFLKQVEKSRQKGIANFNSDAF